MSVRSVREYLKQFALDGRVMEFAVSSATVELAAAALHTEQARIAKTISFAAGEGCILIVAAGDAKVDSSRFKAQFGFKASMLKADEVEAKTGHAIGGVCPFDNPEGASVYTDESLRRFATVFPACGSGSSAIELSMEELFVCSKSRGWVDVCKGWRNEN